jgi:hypothetical protein
MVGGCGGEGKGKEDGMDGNSQVALFSFFL